LAECKNYKLFHFSLVLKVIKIEGLRENS